MFSIDFQLPEYNFKIEMGEKLVFLGSCFSEEISLKFRNAGFDVLSNPFGILFHPTAIANVLLVDDFENTVFERDGLWFSWFASSTVYSTSKSGLINLLVDHKNLLIQYLKSSTCVFITFGTAYEYQLIDQNIVTANCHKMPASLFDKKLTTLLELERVWGLAITEIRKYNPTINIVFTISPVRHIRDGVIENNRSKSRLFELISILEVNESNYFPSYEIVVDELRDYRFYKVDGVHPNELAVNYIWSKLTQYIIHVDSKNVIDEVQKMRLYFAHKSIHPESNSSKKLEQTKNQKLTDFLTRYPLIVW
jgi:hypothetical protein